MDKIKFLRLLYVIAVTLIIVGTILYFTHNSLGLHLFNIGFLLALITKFVISAKARKRKNKA
jgi:hypothetical protein